MKDVNNEKEEKGMTFLNDFAFKTLYMKASTSTKTLINDAIKYYTDIDLNEYNEMWQEMAANVNVFEHASIGDLTFISKDKTHYIDLEVNKEKKEVTKRRNYSHLFTMAANMYDGEDKPYKENRYSYQINLDNYMNEVDKNIISSCYMMTDVKRPNIKDEIIKKYHIYLPRIKNMCYNLIFDSCRK